MPKSVDCQHYHYSILQRAFSVSSVRPPLTQQHHDSCHCSLGRWLLELYHVGWCIIRFIHQTKDMFESVLFCSVFCFGGLYSSPLHCFLIWGVTTFHLIVLVIVSFQVMLLFEPDKI